MTITTSVETSPAVLAIPALAEALYEHWRSSSYELKRQPAYKDATATLQRVFADQAAALVPVVETILKNESTDTVELHNSSEWAKILDVTIMDADGWDRRNFDESWAEKITREEFESRAGRSTSASNADLRKSGWDV
jgi:hypothetical protein